MNILVKIYSCYELTYSAVYKDVLRRIYGNDFNVDEVSLEIEDVSENGTKNIQSQRNNDAIAQRTIRIFEDGCLKHIIGLSNTNYDLDRKHEYDIGNSNKLKNTFGGDGYHANTYLKQGINKIFKLYFENKNTADLSFYLLDTDKYRNYPNNLFNTLSYRELETIGFKILNIENIDFSEYEKKCHSIVNKDKLAFSSFEKYVRDIAYISSINTGNKSSFLQFLEHETNEGYVVDKYIYTFKALSAQAYDSLMRCWCLKKLAQKKLTLIEFKLGKQYFAYNKGARISDKLTGPVKDLFDNAEINIHYLTDEEFMNEIKAADDTYLKHKANNQVRNQSLFRNNLRKLGNPEVCALCGEDNTRVLEAAHIWEVNKIESASAKEINTFLNNNSNLYLIDNNNVHHNELFYKKYTLANAGENGIWLCSNHHGLFDGNYFCFDSDNGKVLLKFPTTIDAIEFAEEFKAVDLVSSGLINDYTRPFFAVRQIAFSF